MIGLELLVIKEINSLGFSVCLKPCLPEVITPTLASEIRNFQNSLLEKYFSSPWEGYFYVIWYSHRGHGFRGRGLDFNYIVDTISHNKESEFENYIKDVFDLLFFNHIGLGLPLINCSIVDREITGISQEFFYLNKINFIKKYEPNGMEKTICPVVWKDVASNLIFPHFLYDNNQFYQFSMFNLKEMRKLIGNAEPSALDEEAIEKIKILFDEMRDETIKEIYNLASTKIKLLQRIAKIQTYSLNLCLNELYR